MIKRLIRIGGFVGKEITEVRRQPLLLLSLILGPFLILLLFGIGYVGEQGGLSAILVLPNDPRFTQDADVYRKQFSISNLNIIDVTKDQVGAVARLRNNETDVVVLIPANVDQQIGAGGQALLPVLYNTADPLRGSQIVGLTLIYTNELNKQTVAAAVGRAQASAQTVDQSLDRMDSALARAQAGLKTGDKATAAGQVQGVQQDAALVQASVGLLVGLMAPQALPYLTPLAGTTPGAATTPLAAATPVPAPGRNLSQGQESVDNFNRDMNDLQTAMADPTTSPADLNTRIQNVRNDIRDLRGLTTQFAGLNPFVLAAPFFGEARNVSPLANSSSSLFTVFYTPAVLALLLQHIALTLASLSMVRERLLGSIELFRVSPITAGEILTGKYVGFGIFLAILSVILTTLTYFGLSVPIFGSYLTLALVYGLLIWASLGLGFAISMVAGTESQAVQISMLVLLTSVFFSGFFLRLDTLWEPVRVLSYALPVTHGIIGLQSVMLNGTDPNPIYLGAMFGLGLLFAAFSMWRFGVEFRRG